MDTAAFYCVSNSRHFLGAVALVNSLRLAGHSEPIYLADCGLSNAERAFLSPEVHLVPTKLGASAHLLKWSAPTIHPAEVQILLDADMIVLRPLTPLLEGAQAGKIVAFADPLWRFYREWGELLQLGAVRPMRYCNAGALALPRLRAEELFPLVRDAQSRIDVSRSMLHGGSSDYPFYFPDQDVWNAVFATRTAPHELVVLDQRLAPHPPFDGLRRAHGNGLVCSYDDGAAPYLLHHVRRKPWLAATPANLYSQLLPRYLLAWDLPLRLPESAVPARFPQQHARQPSSGGASVSSPASLPSGKGSASEAGSSRSGSPTVAHPTRFDRSCWPSLRPRKRRRLRRSTDLPSSRPRPDAPFSGLSAASYGLIADFARRTPLMQDSDSRDHCGETSCSRLVERSKAMKGG